MWLDVYIGELSNAADPLDWNNNVPYAKSPMFPPHGRIMADYPFCQLLQRISSGKFPGKQIDWGPLALLVRR